MADSIRLEVVTPSRQVLSVTAAEVSRLPGRDGLIGVLVDHSPLMTTLGPGILGYLESEGGTEHGIVVDGGFAIIKDNVVTVLAEDARTGDQINVDDCRKALTEAEAALTEGQGSDDEDALRDRIALHESCLELAAHA